MVAVPEDAAWLLDVTAGQPWHSPYPEPSSRQMATPADPPGHMHPVVACGTHASDESLLPSSSLLQPNPANAATIAPRNILFIVFAPCPAPGHLKSASGPPWAERFGPAMTRRHRRAIHQCVMLSVGSDLLAPMVGISAAPMDLLIRTRVGPAPRVGGRGGWWSKGAVSGGRSTIFQQN